MNTNIDTLTSLYDTAIASPSDLPFYQAVHRYFDYIIKTPELAVIIDDEVKRLNSEQEKIEGNRLLSEESKENSIRRLKQGSAYPRYRYLYEKIYVHIEDAKNGVALNLDGLKAWYLFKDIEAMPAKDRKWLLIECEGKREMYEKEFKQLHPALSALIGKRKPVQQDTPKKLRFDDDTSILYVAGFEVKIARQKTRTVEHTILDYLLNHDRKIAYAFRYYDLADDEGIIDDYDDNPASWKRYYNACESINVKVMRQTDGKVKNFLIATAQNAGRVSINKAFLQF